MKYVENITRNNIYTKILSFSLFFCAGVNVLSEGLNAIALYLVIPALFGMSYLSNKGLKTNDYMKTLTWLYVWALVSTTWAKYPDSANAELHQILGAFLLCFIMAVNAKNEKLIPILYSAFIVLLLNCWIYARTHIVMSGVLAANEERMNDRVLDANTFAYYTIFCTFLIYILEVYVKNINYKKIIRAAFLLMLPISFITALMTASRQLLLLEVPFFLVLFYLRYYFNRKSNNKFTVVFFCFILILFLAPKVFDIYTSSYLYERSTMSIAEDTRSLLIEDAIRVGKDHFPLGVGAGNYVNYSFNHHISHNSYTELWANLGIVGLLLYVYMLVRLLIVQYKRYQKTKDSTFLAFSAFALVFICHQMFYTFYAGLWLMGFFILVATHSETYYKNKYLNT